jgi:hypothetical protein
MIIKPIDITNAEVCSHDFHLSTNAARKCYGTEPT